MIKWGFCTSENFFNLSLLAKQGWRLVHDPDSLLGRILCTKYFPNSTFMQAGLGHNPSFTWRSLISGQEVLKEGTMWSVGNGTDRWLQRPSKYMVTVNCYGGDPALRVVELVDWERGRWDDETLEELFLPCDIEVIKGIHIMGSSTLS